MIRAASNDSFGNTSNDSFGNFAFRYTLAATYRQNNRKRVRESKLRIFDNFVNLACFGNFAFG